LKQGSESSELCQECEVLPRPGSTTLVQTVKLGSLTFLDTPGVSFSNVTNKSNRLLQNCLKFGYVEDPIPIVQLIVERIPQQQLITLYQVVQFDDVSGFLNNVKHKRGKRAIGLSTKKKQVARRITADWCRGEIPFYIEPPKVESETVKSLSILSSEFNVNEWLEGCNQRNIAQLPNIKLSEGYTILPNLPVIMDEATDEEEEEIRDDAMDETSENEATDDEEKDIPDDAMDGVKNDGDRLNQDNDGSRDQGIKGNEKIRRKSSELTMDQGTKENKKKVTMEQGIKGDDYDFSTDYN